MHATRLAFFSEMGLGQTSSRYRLDPQFNVSQYVLGVHRYQADVIDADRPTVWDIFEQASRTPGLKSSGRSISNAVLNVVQYQDGARLDIIASQLELSYTLKNPRSSRS
jgi:chromosome partitioning protein